MNRIAVALTLSAALVACRGSGDDTTGDDGGTDSPGGGVHIQDVQNVNMAVGTPVALKGVIVTAIDMYGTKTGDIWIEEAGGGEFSGVHVFGAPLATVGTLAVGDIVDIAGAQKDEFTYMGTGGVGGDMSGRSITELKPVNGGMMTVTKTGTGTVPAPMAVDALAIGQKATQLERDAEWEKWEGVLIKVTNVTAVTGAKCVGKACSDPTLNSFSATGGIVVESSIAGFPGTAPGSIAKNDCLAGITGIVDYFFDYLLFPTSTANIMTGGTGCPVAEGASHAVCSDMIDNDGNGFTDCLDNGCIVGDATCRTTTTIPAIQAATPTGPIELTSVYITAISHNKRSIWVSQNPQAAVNEGVYVFNAGGGAQLDNTFVVGAKVNVIGSVQEYNDDMLGGTLTELNSLKTTLVTGTGTVVPVVGKTVAELSMPAVAPMYESVLVTLTNVNLTALGTQANGYVATATQSGTTFKIGTDALLLVAADMGCHVTMTGLWTNLQAPLTNATTKPNAFGFIPTAMAAVGGACP